MKIVKHCVFSVLVGIIVGILTLIGQKYLPISLNFLANSGAIWLIPAFLLSYYLKSEKIDAIATSTVCLLSCVLGYYIFESIYHNHSFEIGFFVTIWLVCAVIGGIIFGLGASLAAHETNRLKYFGQNLLPAVFLAEGINKTIHISEYMHMITAVILTNVIGVLLFILINKKSSLKKRNILSLIILTVLGLLGYEVLFWLTG